MSGTKSFTIKYDVHCKFQNFFGKETIVKNCMSEMHAKVKLNEWCKTKYGIEFTHIIIKTCVEKLTLGDSFDSIFGDAFGQMKNDKKSMKDLFGNAFKNK